MYTLSLHDALPISRSARKLPQRLRLAARWAAARRRWGSFLALLAALAAIAIVAIALLSSSSGTSVDPVNQPDVQGQIDGLRDFIQQHSR